MANLVEASTNKGMGRRSFNFVICHVRIRDLLAQIENIKPLLTNTDPDVVLRASQEIRDLHSQINTITELSKNTDQARWKRRIQRKREKKAEKEKREEKRRMAVSSPEILFRPPV
jgi:hypothetical protein